MNTRRMGAAVAAAALGLTLAACGSDAGDTGSDASSSGDAAASGLKVGIKFDQPGLGLKKGSEYTGFDVDVATYIAKELGVEANNIEWVEAPSAERENLIKRGDVDFIVATYSITDKRKAEVDFAGPYFLAHQDLLVRRNETEITGPTTLDGKDLCSVPGTTSAENVLKFYRGRIQLKEFPRFSDCVQALNNSEVDAVTTDDVILAGFAAQPQYQGKLKLVGQGFSDENYGVGIKKGNTALVDQVNAALKQYVADGSWAAALRITVAPSGYRLPSPPTPGAA